MRKWNGVITALVLVLFMIHGIMGSFQLMGAASTAMKGAAWAAVVLVLIHAAISTKLTIDTLRTVRKTGAPYIRQNLLFWARRLSGFVLLILLVFHMTAFADRGGAAYRLKPFNTGRLVTQLLMAAVLAVHLISNIKPALITFGIKGLRKKTGHLLFALSVLLLFMTAALIIYYIRWNRL